MDNPKVEVIETGKYGKGLFAKEAISKDEIISEFDGEIYNYTDDLDKYLHDHAIQFATNKVRVSKGIAIYTNHSCEPNCGIKDLFKIVAMRNIMRGEEITIDYKMSEHFHDKRWEWKMECKCGSKNCRKIISSCENLNPALLKKYKGYVSEWLLEKC